MATGAQIEGALVTDCPHHCGKVPKPKVAWGNDSFTVTGKYYPIKNTSEGGHNPWPPSYQTIIYRPVPVLGIIRESLWNVGRYAPAYMNLKYGRVCMTQFLFLEITIIGYSFYFWPLIFEVFPATFFKRHPLCWACPGTVKTSNSISLQPHGIDTVVIWKEWT